MTNNEWCKCKISCDDSRVDYLPKKKKQHANDFYFAFACYFGLVLRSFFFVWFNRTEFNGESLLSLCKHTLVFRSIKIVNDKYAMCTHDKKWQKNTLQWAVHIECDTAILSVVLCNAHSIRLVDGTELTIHMLIFRIFILNSRSSNVCACALWRSLII